MGTDDGLAKYPYVRESRTVSYTHLRAHETVLDLVCRLLLEKKKKTQKNQQKKETKNNLNTRAK